MAWRDNPLVVQELATQGFVDEDSRNLSKNTLAIRIKEIFGGNPVRSSDAEYLVKLAKVRDVGISSDELIEQVLPGFLEDIALNDEERQLLAAEPKDHPELSERVDAAKQAHSLLWGTTSKGARSGPVQQLLVNEGLLLIEADVTRNNVNTKVKVATDDHDLIIEWYVRPRGDKLVQVSSTVRDDCQMVGLAFPEINTRMRKELGSQLVTAVQRLSLVAAPDFDQLVLASGTEQQQLMAIG